MLYIYMLYILIYIMYYIYIIICIIYNNIYYIYINIYNKIRIKYNILRNFNFFITDVMVEFATSLLVCEIQMEF